MHDYVRVRDFIIYLRNIDYFNLARDVEATFHDDMRELETYMMQDNAILKELRWKKVEKQ